MGSRLVGKNIMINETSHWLLYSRRLFQLHNITIHIIFPNEQPIVEYLKSKGSQHTWWGALAAGDFKRVKEYVDNGQDVNEINPVLHNGNAAYVAQEYAQTRIVQWLVTQGAAIVVRNCANNDTHEMKWSVGRGDAFYYKAQKVEKPGVGVQDHWIPEFKS